MKTNKMIQFALTVVMAAGSMIGAKAYADVPRQNRALVIVSELDTRGMRELRPLYQALEHITVSLAKHPSFTGSDYQVIRVLENQNATFARFKATLKELAANPQIRAIDTIIALHGSDGHISFSDVTWNLRQMKNALLMAPTPEEQRIVLRMKQKMRLLYNLSCYGASHRVEFREMGYDTVIGSIGVNANAEVEYPSVLGLWGNNMTISEAFLPTNNDGAIAVADAPIKLSGQIGNNSLKYTNSKKIIAGNRDLRISSDPN